MATVYALFNDLEALEQARAGLEGARVIPGLALQGEVGVERPMEPEQGHAGRATLDSTKLVEGHTLEDELIERGVPPESGRMFADALRSGAGLLIVEGDPALLRGRLIESGAGHVSGGRG
ncbi:MAG: hypothetical protein SFU83_00490 [Meiothermus sp.]|nr:hypothetical protein [Meiothermus sp.]